MFSLLARLTVAHPWKVCAAWVLAAVGLTIAAPDWRSQAQDDDIRFLPKKHSHRTCSPAARSLPSSVLTPP